MISAFPLQWPTGWLRTKPTTRRDGKFTKGERVYSSAPGGSSWTRHRDLTVSDGVSRVLKELERFAIDRQEIVISTNVRTRLDGLPRSGEREPEDPGAAVYWVDPFINAKRVMAIDQYTTVADNLAAIAATLDAMRAIERHGGAQILDRAFTGFTALSAPGQDNKRIWREVMGFAPGEPVDADTLKIRFRKKAAERHPDKEGGSHEAMTELNVAMAEAEKEIGE